MLYSRNAENTISPHLCDRVLCPSKRGIGRRFLYFSFGFFPSSSSLYSLSVFSSQVLPKPRGVWCAIVLLGRPGNDPVELILRARTEAPRRAGIGQRLGPFLCSLPLRARASIAVAALDLVITVFPPSCVLRLSAVYAPSECRNTPLQNSCSSRYPRLHLSSYGVTMLTNRAYLRGRHVMVGWTKSLPKVTQGRFINTEQIIKLKAKMKINKEEAKPVFFFSPSSRCIKLNTTSIQNLVPT